MVLKPDKLKKPALEKAQNQYLITWSIKITPENLQQISSHPQVLQKGLDYITRTTKQNKLKIYRVADLTEVTSFTGLRDRPRNAARPHGIAILEAPSIEYARKFIDNLVEGFSYGFGDVSVKNYLEYDIKNLIDVSSLGGR